MSAGDVPSGQAPVALAQRPWVVGSAFVAAYLLLDWISYIRPMQGLNITPWNPQPALAVALLMRNARWLPLVWFSLMAADLGVRGWPAEWTVAVAASSALALVYGAMARSLRVAAAGAMATRTHLLAVTVVGIVGSLLGGVAYVATLTVGGMGPAESMLSGVARYWIGDAVGFVVTLPLLLALQDSERRQRLAALARKGEAFAIAAVIGTLLALVIGTGPRDPFKYFYLLFVPVVWASARFGLAGAVASSGLTQLGLLLGLQFTGNSDTTVFGLQVLMAAIAMTGLTLGVTVDERERVDEELRGSLRLAAAGQMAAALAHELSQPLTALNTHVHAARLVASADRLTASQRLEQLSKLSDLLASDAQRASEVVKRLRDFFMSGSTQLRPQPIGPLIQDTVQSLSSRQSAIGADVQYQVDETLPPVLVDSVQMAVVLRNLLANALDAVAEVPPPRLVEISAVRRGDCAQINFHDSGRGIDVQRVDRLFDPGRSDKPAGMGIGLSICRAIVEAHGGTLWAEAGPAGRFHLTLPLDDEARENLRHAP
jgi:signal transduction histidine kinase